jgi:PAS domain S-box-containing protein
MIIEDIATFPALAGTIDREIALAEDIRATLSTPMMSRAGELIGVLNTQFRQPHRPSERELRVMDMLAWTAAGFIERHSAGEAALRESEERYRILFDAIDEGFYFARALFDADGRCTDIVYDDENPAAVRMTGRSAKGRRLSELGDYEDYWREVFGTVARTGEPRRLEHYAAPDGLWYDFYVFKPPEAAPGGFAVVFRDVTGRKRAEEALRASEERQAFLLKLSDDLRPLTDPAEIVAAAAEALGRHLGAGQVVYAENDLAGEYVTIEREWNDGSIPSNARRHRLDEFGPAFIADLKRGESTAIPDVSLDPRTSSPQALATFARASIASLLNVPLMKEGRLVAILGVHDSAPHAWRAEDVATTKEVAERIWSAVERARAEAALRTSEERLRSALEIDTVAVLFWGPDMRLKQVNPAFLAMTGFGRDEALGLTWQELTPPEFHAVSERAVAQIEAAGWAEPYEKQYFRKDGSRWWGLFAPRRLSDGEVVEFVLDVSDRLEKERALGESEERFRLIVESARDYAIFTTDPEGRISGWWGGAESVFGWSADEALGAVADITFTPEDRAEGAPEWERATARDEGRAPNVRWHLRKDGSRVFIEGVTVALRSGTGELTGFLKIGQDMTERSKAQKHERMLLAELQHRVRNTLAVVRSIARRTAESSASVEEMSDHLQGRLAAFSRVQAAVTRDPTGGVDLTNLIEDELLAHATREGPRLRIEGGEISLQPKAAESISLAIHELTTNAVKYGALADRGGRLEIGWSIEREGPRQLLRFHWRERGVAGAGNRDHKGFGTELLLRSLPYELDAQTDLRFAADGISFEMTIPAERALAEK